MARERQKRDYRQEVADEFIEAIKNGTAPWMKPWKTGEIYQQPFNPTTNKPYRGINNMVLDLATINQGYSDPRWMTYKQALDLGGQVRKGETSRPIEYWQWKKSMPMMDENNKPLLDENGQKKYHEIKLNTPNVFHASVFNAEQIDGLDKYEYPKPDFKPHERAEEMIGSLDIPITHYGNKAFYNPTDHRINMPPKNTFKSQDEYYSTLLHEAGHSTGHKSLLARDLSGGFGSELYAREELRAEIASYMVARETGITHDPSRHAAYVGSWIKNLQNNKNEIYRATRDAEIIKTFITTPEARQSLIEKAQASRAMEAEDTSMTVKVNRVANKQTDTTQTANIPSNQEEQKRNYLFVPFAEKDQAKALGARWNKTEKRWFVPANLDADNFKKWANKPIEEEKPKDDPQTAFGRALKEQGLVVKGAPVMDGKWHRVPVDSDAKGAMSGSYRGFLDGVPNGQILNFKTSDEAVKWFGSKQVLNTPIDDKKLEESNQEIKRVREQELKDQRAKAIRTSYGIWNNAKPASSNHPYLTNKQIKPHGLKQTEDGKLIIPLFNKDDKLRNLQMIDGDGKKRFLKGGEKVGNYHMLGEVKKPNDQILIAEGFATAASLHEATGRPVATAFDAGNLRHVGEALREKYPKNEIVFAADEDAKKARNIGVERANEAVKAIPGSRAIMPKFKDSDLNNKASDFNDYANLYGKDRLANNVNSVLKNRLAWTKGQSSSIPKVKSSKSFDNEDELVA